MKKVTLGINEQCCLMISGQKTLFSVFPIQAHLETMRHMHNRLCVELALRRMLYLG